MALRPIQTIFLQNFAKLILYVPTIQGYTCTAGELLRTKEQAAWYASKGIGIINSLHINKLAGDLNIFKDGVLLKKTPEYKIFGDYWESLSIYNKWGGRFNDGNHFEMHTIDWRKNV